MLYCFSQFFACLHRVWHRLWERCEKVIFSEISGVDMSYVQVMKCSNVR